MPSSLMAKTYSGRAAGTRVASCSPFSREQRVVAVRGDEDREDQLDRQAEYEQPDQPADRLQLAAPGFPLLGASNPAEPHRRRQTGERGRQRERLSEGVFGDDAPEHDVGPDPTVKDYREGSLDLVPRAHEVRPERQQSERGPRQIGGQDAEWVDEHVLPRVARRKPEYFAPAPDGGRGRVAGGLRDRRRQRMASTDLGDDQTNPAQANARCTGRTQQVSPTEQEPQALLRARGMAVA